jgi:hypothetical protein
MPRLRCVLILSSFSNKVLEETSNFLNSKLKFYYHISKKKHSFIFYINIFKNDCSHKKLYNCKVLDKTFTYWDVKIHDNAFCVYSKVPASNVGQNTDYINTDDFTAF